MHRITSAHFSLWIAVGDNVRCNWLRSELRAMAIYSTWNPRYTRRSPGWTARGSYYGPRYARSRTSRRKANAEARAARQQRDSTTVTLNRIASFPVEIPIGTGSAGISIAHWNELRLSTYFQNYSPMYDQMKLDKIRVKVVGSQAAAIQTTSISPAVVLAFDRNGLNAGQSLNPSSISTYSSSQMKNWSLGNAFTMYQTIYPSTIMEKGQYVPTDSLVDPADDDSGTNPCTSISDPTLPFKPITLLGISTGANQTAVQTYVFTLELEYTVTFRGMRKPSLSYLDLVPFVGDITENGRYRLTAEQADVPGWNSLDILVKVPTKPVLAYVDFSDSPIQPSGTRYPILLASPTGTVICPGGSSIFFIEYIPSSSVFRLRFIRNNLGQAVELTPAEGTQLRFIQIVNSLPGYVHVLNTAQQSVLVMIDATDADGASSNIYLSTGIFEVTTA